MKNFQRITALITIITILMTSMSFAPVSPTETVLRLQEHGGLHFVTVKINGKNADLLLDTGCYKSFLDISQYKTYEFEFKLRPQKVYGIGGQSANSYWITRKSCRVTYDSFILPANWQGADLAKLHRTFMEHNVDIAGILGSDFLQTYKVTIDYNKKELIARNLIKK